MRKSSSGYRLRPSRVAPAARWDVSLGNQSGIWREISPPQLFVGSFAMLVLLGTFGFLLIPGLYTSESLSWCDALFTSTSAVCVTGLTVVDTETSFTFRGQCFILLLIQLGGLGMLAFTSLVIQILGFRLSLRAEALTHDARKGGPQVDLKRLTIDVVVFTFLIEAVGAIALLILWGPKMGWTESIWPAIFHSVSAFCNAGFSTNSDSLIGLRDSPGTLLVISGLIIAGGIGFVAMEEAVVYFSNRHRAETKRLSAHTRLILVTTLILLVVPWPMFAFFEWQGTLKDLSVADKVVNSFFLSSTARTAGFNSIDYSQASDSTNFLTIILMSIGGSPGSTAGGMKTTTFALIILLAWSRLRGSETAIFANRSLPDDTIQRAIGLAVVCIVITTIGVFALSITENVPNAPSEFLPRMFEAFSAFNTVGLSMNLTPHLSFAGRIVTITLMFLGRVGPLTLAAALVIGRKRKTHFRFAYEDVAVG